MRIKYGEWYDATTYFHGCTALVKCRTSMTAVKSATRCNFAMSNLQTKNLKHWGTSMAGKDPMHDPRKDPRAGDMIQVRADWTRRVVNNDGEFVGFTASMDGVVEKEPYIQRLKTWIKTMANAEVLHVAE